MRRVLPPPAQASCDIASVPRHGQQMNCNFTLHDTTYLKL